MQLRTLTPTARIVGLDRAAANAPLPGLTPTNSQVADAFDLFMLQERERIGRLLTSLRGVLQRCQPNPGPGYNRYAALQDVLAAGSGHGELLAMVPSLRDVLTQLTHPLQMPGRGGETIFALAISGIVAGLESDEE